MWERDSFLLEWEASLPSTHRPDAAWLQGVCLEEKNVAGEACLRYLPAETMPLEPGERVKRLFEARKRWRLEEIAPYMRSVGDLLRDKRGRKKDGVKNGSGADSQTNHTHL